MVAIPLAATLFTAIIRWQRSREVSQSEEFSSLNAGLDLYGSLKLNGSCSNESSSSAAEESRGKYKEGFVCDSLSVLILQMHLKRHAQRSCREQT